MIARSPATIIAVWIVLLLSGTVCHVRQASGLSSSIAGTGATFTIPPAVCASLENRAYPSVLHNVHVRSLLSDEEVATCLQIATEYAESTGCWSSPDTERHSTYATCDFSILDECEAMQKYLAEISFDERMWNELSETYGIPQKEMSYLDFFCAHYQTKTSESPNVMDRLEEHRDGSMLSFTLTLSDPTSFTGGGTFFDALRDLSSEDQLLTDGVVRPLRAGDVVLHSGKALHGAKAITSGSRTVLVGFVDVAPWWERPGVLGSSCRDWGRMDVAAARNKRQLSKCNEKKKGWLLNTKKWVSKGNASVGKSAITGYCPAFPSVEIRASPNFQRQRRLEAEDRLLRGFLLSPQEVQTFDDDNGDITVL